jgi:hypothetical protein
VVTDGGSKKNSGYWITSEDKKEVCLFRADLKWLLTFIITS